MEESNVTMKKPKKHKKKHKHKDREKSREPVTSPTSGLGGLKIKIKFGGLLVKSSPEQLKPEKRKYTSAAAEEEKWLKALEAGDLDERGELKADGAVKLTSRQRAIRVEGKRSAERRATLVEAAVAAKLVKDDISPEMLARRQESNLRRKLINDKKQDQAKAATVQKLLQKQSSQRLLKHESSQLGNRYRSQAGPNFRYFSSKNQMGVSVSAGAQFPIAAQPARPYPAPRESCGVDGCSNPRRYVCSKTNIPLCGLRCYTANLTSSTTSPAEANLAF